MPGHIISSDVLFPWFLPRRNIQIEERVMTIVIPIVTPRQIPFMGVGSWLVVLKPMSLPLIQDSPLGSSVAQNAYLDLTKSSTLRIISVTVRGARLEKRLANSGHLELLMKVKIRITSKTFCMNLVSKAAEPTLCRAVQGLLEHPAPHGHCSFSLIYSPNKLVDVIIEIRRTIIYLHVASSSNTGRIGVINASDFSLCCLMMDMRDPPSSSYYGRWNNGSHGWQQFVEANFFFSFGVDTLAMELSFKGIGQQEVGRECGSAKVVEHVRGWRKDRMGRKENKKRRIS
nr:hypothetical protein [Tanacetum cinerariifolium]